MTQKAPLNTHVSLILDDEIFENTGREVSEMNSQSPRFLALLQKFSFYVPHFLLKGREPFSYIAVRIIGWHVQLLTY